MQATGSAVTTVIYMVMLMFGIMLGMALRVVPAIIKKVRASSSGLALARCMFITTGYKMITRDLPIHIIGSNKAVFFRKGMYLLRDSACFYASSLPTIIYREGNPLPVVTRDGSVSPIPATEVRSAIRSKVVEDLNAATQNKQIVQAMLFSLISVAVSAVGMVFIYMTMRKVNIIAKVLVEIAKVSGVT